MHNKPAVLSLSAAVGRNMTPAIAPRRLRSAVPPVEDTGMNRDGTRLGVAVVIVLGVLVMLAAALTVAPNAIPALQVLVGVPVPG